MKKILFLFLSFLLFACPSFAENFYIKNYDINIKVSNDNIYHIKETIDVFFTKPSHGIFRSIPLKNNIERNDGTKYTNRAKVKGINATELVSSNWNNGYINYKMGNPNYKITGDKRYFLEYDYILSPNSINQNEFYFNLIGTEWNTNIKHVNFKIDMPKEFNKDLIGFSVGKYGDIGHSNRIKFETNNLNISGHTTKPLFAKEALTIRIPLQKNYFEKRDDIQANKYIFFAILLTYISLIFWYTKGKDEPIIPVVTFYPPQNLSSAEIAAIYKNQIDSSCASCLILELASQGYLTINEYNDSYLLTKLKEYDGKNSKIKAFCDVLFKLTPNDKIYFSTMKESRKFSKAIMSFEKALNEFKKNIYELDSISIKNHATPLICSLTLVIMFLSASNDYTLSFILNFTPLLIFLFFGLFIIKISLFSKEVPISTKLFVMGWFLSAYCISIPIFYKAGLFSNILAPSSLITLIGSLISIICTINMPRKNIKGRKVLGEILGFKKFIETVEKKQLELLAKQNPDYIHKVLPYAFALGIDGIWLDKISEIETLTKPEWINDTYNRTTFKKFKTITNETISQTRFSGNSRGHSGGSRCGGGSGGGGGGSW